ncbi:MAG: CHAT domain-containing protein [Myxococcales bacterium]|nr:CHAT domain-containing protein [Myxococcales bacterium]
MLRRPLLVHLCWSPRDTAAVRGLALELYGFLGRPPGDDPVLRPGVGIPTEIGRDLVALTASLASGTEAPADARVVVPLLAEGGYADPQFRAALDRLVQQVDGIAGLAVLPLALDPRWRTSLGVDDVDAIATISRGGASLLPGRDRFWTLGSDVGVAIGRRLFGPDGRSATPRIFISHTKTDLEQTARLAARLHDHIATRTRMEVHFDEDDLERGRRLRAQLRHAPHEAVVLVLRTDSYSESPWCTEELLVAKAERVPIVTVLSTRAGESRTSAYGGNHRTIHWQPDREAEVVGRCVQAWLHHHHFLAFGRATLELAGLPSDSLVLSRRPELLDVGTGTRGLVVYPDPPMPEAERDVLRANRPDVRVATPNTLYGRVLMDRDTAPPLADVTLAFSLSDDSRLLPLEQVEVGSGITRTHLRDALDTVVLSTIQTGARIAYGGDFRRGGFSEKVSNLLQAHRRLGLGGRPQLLCYQSDGAREGDGQVVYEPIEVAPPPGTSGVADDELRSMLWHLAMRRASSSGTTARVLLGGKSRPRAIEGDDGYQSTWPGVLEEAYRTAQAGRALYVIGGFGGCAGDIAELLTTDGLPAELDHATHARHPGFDALVQAFEAARVRLGEQPGADRDLLLLGPQAPLRMNDLAAALRLQWSRFVQGDAAAWPNGLTVAENLALLRSTDATEIAHLIFSGLARVRDAAPSRGTLALRCYHGDIASIPGVDAYAVTITPGMEPVGASAAIDARCGGRLRRVVPAHGVEVVAVGSNALAGRHVVVATLDLPPGAVTLEASAVEDLALLVGRACKRLGLVSVACPAFGTTLGVGVATAVQAMLRGFERAGAPAAVTFCEIDPGRLAELRSALPPGGFEDLREGPLPPTPPERAVLYLAARAPTDGTTGVIEAKLFRDDLGATVPCGASEPIDLATWTRLRSRCSRMTEVALHGELLARLLPAAVQQELRAHPEAQLSVVLDETASGLPWEALGHRDPAWTPAITVPLTRRIAMSDAEATLAPASRRGPKLRVLVVADPTSNLPGAREETAAIASLLRARADVELSTIAGPAATLDAVRRALEGTSWDVFHYAGHAFFDPQAPGSSGLELADGVLVAGAIADVHVPRLIVLGACESARVRGPADSEQDPRAARWSFAEGVLRRGVRSFIGTFFVVDDPAARDFSTTLYEGLLAGRRLGTAVRDARARLHAQGQPDWANFLLFGDGALTL